MMRGGSRRLEVELGGFDGVWSIIRRQEAAGSRPSRRYWLIVVMVRVVLAKGGCGGGFLWQCSLMMAIGSAECLVVFSMSFFPLPLWYL